MPIDITIPFTIHWPALMILSLMTLRDSALTQPQTTSPATTQSVDDGNPIYRRAVLLARQEACLLGHDVCGPGCCPTGRVCVSTPILSCALSAQATDSPFGPLTTVPTSPSSTLNLTSSLSSPTNLTTSSAVPSETTSSGPGGLPSSAVAGMAVGSALGGIVVALAGAYLVHRRLTKRQRWRVRDEVENPFARRELDGIAIQKAVEVANDPSQPELVGRELPASPFELESPSPVIELDTGRDGVSESENIENEKMGS